MIIISQSFHWCYVVSFCHNHFSRWLLSILQKYDSPQQQNTHTLSQQFFPKSNKILRSCSGTTGDPARNLGGCQCYGWKCWIQDIDFDVILYALENKIIIETHFSGWCKRRKEEKFLSEKFIFIERIMMQEARAGCTNTSQQSD